MQYFFFHPEILELITDGEAEASHEIISLFLSQIDGLDSSLNLLLEKEDFVNLKATFHKLRAGCQMVGIPSMYDFFTFGEDCIAANNVLELKLTIEKVRISLPTIAAELKDYLLSKPL